MKGLKQRIFESGRFYNQVGVWGTTYNDTGEVVSSFGVPQYENADVEGERFYRRNCGIDAKNLSTFRGKARPVSAPTRAQIREGSMKLLANKKGRGRYVSDLL